MLHYRIEKLFLIFLTQNFELKILCNHKQHLEFNANTV